VEIGDQKRIECQLVLFGSIQKRGGAGATNGVNGAGW
jgi:hypothetical protein